MIISYFTIGILAVFAFVSGFWVIGILLYRWRARRLVRARTDEEKCRDLNDALMPFGFQYDICQDIFYSTKDAWQRKTGYGKIYDDNAIGMNMVIDCEPIYFTHNGMSYMMELWKGQYGILTGSEIGIYVTDEVNEEHPERLFYHTVSDEEMLPFRFILKKGDRILLIRDEIHWWLTGFCLGEFSRPAELSMEAAIGFANWRMRDAFYHALLSAGYHKSNVYLDGSYVRFNYTKTHTVQPKHSRFRVWLVQRMNRKNCKRYHRLTKGFTRTIDRVDYLGMCFPGMYRMLGRMSRLPVKKCRRKDKNEHRKKTG